MKGFKGGAQFKKFNTREEAQDFIDQKVGGVIDRRKPESSSHNNATGDYLTLNSFLKRNIFFQKLAIK